MGRVQRFKILKTGISKYKAPVDQAGTGFYKYNQFRLGKATYNVSGQTRGDDELYDLTPFGVGGATPQKYTVQASGRLTDGNLTTYGLNKTELGLATSTTTTTAIFSPDFIPAKVVVKQNGAKDKDHISQITGAKYTKVAGDTFTFPFGRKADADREFDRQTVIYTLVELATGDFTVTFKPERMYGHGA